MSNYAICTIATKSYIPYAKTLMESVHRHNPQLSLYVLVADEVDSSLQTELHTSECIDYLYLEDLQSVDPTSAINSMAFYYNTFEFCNGIRGFLHRYLYEKTEHEAWLYLDSDIFVLHSLDGLFESLSSASILLNPHLTSPVPKPYVNDCEVPVITNGLYNSGFLGLKRSPTTAQFIQWFQERLIYYSFHDREHIWQRGLFVDQQWLNLVPLYFSDTQLVTTPGINLAHWNLFRNLAHQNKRGQFFIDKLPVVFVHFSGWDIQHPQRVTKYSSIYDQKTPECWKQLGATYQKSLYRNGYEQFSNLPYSYNFFKDSTPIALAMREFYYQHIINETWEAGNPFECQQYFKDIFYPSMWEKLQRKIRVLLNP
jgi:lipopolysaccharide biosynthesis glycosyltransferase